MFKFSLGLSALFVLSACGDRTVEQYNREKVDTEFAKILPIVGSYVGTVKSAGSGEDISKMILVLDADKKIIEQSSQSVPQQQTIITGVVSFEGSINSSIAFTNGVFDPDQKKFQLQLPIARRNGQTMNLDLSGQFDGDQVVGRLAIREYPKDGGNFVLTKSTEKFTPFYRRSSNADSEYITPLKWTGSTGKNAQDRVDLFLLPQALSDEEKIANLFSSVKFFKGGIDFGGIIRVSIEEVRWDTRYGTLNADGYIKSDEYGDQNISLNCTASIAKESGNGWRCFYANLSGGAYFEINFIPAAK